MKWCIKVTKENLPIVGKWFDENSQNGADLFDNKLFINNYYHYPVLNNYHRHFKIQEGYTELTFEQFKEQILKEPNVLQEILDKIIDKSYEFHDGSILVEFKDIEQIFSNYLNK